MKVAGIREIRARSSSLLGGGEPVIVTRHGKVSGLYLPLDTPDSIPDDLRSELARVLGAHLAEIAEQRGLAEQELRKGLDAHRRGRR